MVWTGAILGLAGIVAGFSLAVKDLRRSEARLGRILTGAAATPWRGVVVGAAVTAFFQSSSLVTIFLVGCVDAGLITLPRVVPLLAGANIGTTASAYLLAGLADMPSALWLGTFMVGLGLWRRRNLLLGFGILLLALEILGNSLSVLAGEPWFSEIMVVFSERPWMAVLAGGVLSAMVFSSSVTMGLLQQMVEAGLLPRAASLPFVFGSNVGTTADTLLASLAGGREARAAALVHLLFNVVGVLIFLPLLPFLLPFLAVPAGDSATQLALAHTVFNVVTALIAVPAAGRLAAAGRYLAGGWRSHHHR